MLKIGVQTGVLFDDDNYEYGMELVKQAGFDCMDFNIDTKINARLIAEGKPDLFFSQSDEQLKAYYAPQKEKMKELGLTLSQMHGPFPVYVADNPQATDILVQATVKCLMLCEFFECPYLVVHPGRGQTLEQEWEINRDLYSRFIPYAKKYGVGICLENMFASKHDHITEAVCSDIRQAVQYIDDLNQIAGEEIFSFCYDLGHATLLGKNIRRSIDLLGSRLKVLHIHDNNAERDCHFQPYAFSRGHGYVTDWEAFIEGLNDIHYQGVLSFETFNSLECLPKELYPVMLAYIAGVGKYFAQRLESEQV